MNRLFLAALTAASLLGPDLLAQLPDAGERAAQLKATMASSQAALRQYEWIETTTVSVNGEEKSNQMERCYYGADGKVQKVPLASPAPEERRRGLRGRIAERRKEELQDYMKEAVALVRQYVPPDPTRIQAARDAGRLSIQPQPGNQRTRLTFTDYLKAGDSLSLDIDLANNRPVSATVKSYLDSQKEPVSLAVTFGTLNDGTVYASESKLTAPGKNLAVTVDNSGYRKTP